MTDQTLFVTGRNGKAIHTSRDCPAAQRTRAIRSEYADADPAPDVPDLPDSAREGLGVLMTHAGDGSMIEVDRARSLIADRLNIPAESVRAEVFEPLRAAGEIAAVSRLRAAYVVLTPEKTHD